MINTEIKYFLLYLEQTTRLLFFSQVLISAHVPYGVGALGDYVHMYQPYNERFLTLVKEYSDIIMGSFFGHEHNDAYKLVYNDGL